VGRDAWQRGDRLEVRQDKKCCNRESDLHYHRWPEGKSPLEGERRENRIKKKRGDVYGQVLTGGKNSLFPSFSLHASEGGRGAISPGEGEGGRGGASWQKRRNHEYLEIEEKRERLKFRKPFSCSERGRTSTRFGEE